MSQLVLEAGGLWPGEEERFYGWLSARQATIC